MLVGVEAQGHVELFAFVDGLLARGEANGDGVIGLGALDVDGNVARDGPFLPVDVHEYLPGVDSSGLSGRFQLERVDASLVPAAVSTSEKGVEHVFHAGADYLVGAIDAGEGKAVLRLYGEIVAVGGELLQGKYELQAECLARFHAFPVQLQGRTRCGAEGQGEAQ